MTLFVHSVYSNNNRYYYYNYYYGIEGLLFYTHKETQILICIITCYSTE